MRSAIIQQADGMVPGLYNLLLVADDGTLRDFWDLTGGQICDVLRQHGVDPAQIYAAPRGSL